MWFWTAGICSALAGTMYGFSTIVAGLTQTQKYAYNALITGLSIVLGLAFAAQFKQYAEMMRWRFLASQYRSIQDFEEVLGCDSYRSTLSIMWNGRRAGTWSPSKSQVVAAFWLAVFVAFNTFAALLGLTYSIDVSDTFVSTSYGTLSSLQKILASSASLLVRHCSANQYSGPVSVADLRYIASQAQPNNGKDYYFEYQKKAANLWGQVGQNFDTYLNETLDDVSAPPGGAVYTNNAQDAYWYRFVDLSPNDQKTNIVSYRTVSSQATCVEYKVTYGGWAGFNTDNVTTMFEVDWVDDNGNTFSDTINDVATGSTTWMGNSTRQKQGCGPRCARILALQSASNETGSITTTPRLWSCNNTVGQVANALPGAFDNPEALNLPDDQAFYLAGSIGWTGVETTDDELQFMLFDGDTIFNPAGDGATAEDIASLVMQFTAGAVAAIDTYQGPRQNQTGQLSPGPAQVVNIKWAYAGAILGGIPVLQFIMLLGVVWFASKAIILEPSYMTAAHLLYPVIQKVGKDGCLFTVDEMAERLGPNFKVSYGVRPDPADPGHHDTTFVRDLDLIEEREGFGYIRGNMPEGRYD